MKKRIVSLILAVLVVAGLATAVFATEPTETPTTNIRTGDPCLKDGCTGHYAYSTTKEATCTAEGTWSYYYCDICGDMRRYNGTEIASLAELKIEKKPHTTSLVSEIPATCTEEGRKAYYKCSVCSGKFSDIAGTKPVTDAELVLPANGHKGEVRYTWTEDHAKCTASRTCTVCNAVDSEEATATKSVKTAATCTTDGKYQYTATFNKPGFTTQTVDGEDIPKLGHDWKEKTWTWTQKGDSWTVKLVLACNRDGCTATAEPKVTLTSKVTIEPTATKVGERTWTATATQDGQTFTSVKKTEIPKKGSDYYYGATLYFETNGGSKIDAVTVYTDTTIDLTLAKYTPTRRGYTFAGWYSDKNLRYPISEITLKTGWFLNKYNTYTVYAGWYDGDYDYNCSACAFRDVDVNDWFHDYVRYVVDNGILNGISSRWFEPQQAMTREQLVCAMYRIAGSPSVRYNGVFTDVKSTDSFAKAVEWAANYGIVNGIGNKLFDPYSPVTREQMAAIFYRFAKYVEKYGYTPYRTTGFYWNYSSTLTFKDADKISNYAKDPVAWCVKNGIFYGDNSNRFNPTNSTTRAEGAAILTRFCK